MLRERLIQCGWRDDLKEYCKDVIRRKGLEKVTIEELVAEITPKGRCKILLLFILFFTFSRSLSIATIPDEVKAELLLRIRKFLQAT
jgi:enhancer of yellow 2 transcription factor